MNKKAKKRLLSAVYLVTALLIVKLVLAAAPYFDPDPDGEVRVLQEDQLFTWDINATDDDGDPLNFSDDTDLFDIHKTTGVINFTPDNDDVGEYPAIVLIVKDVPYSALDIAVVNFTVNNTNDAPNITAWIPANLNVSTYENVTGGVAFNITVRDDDLKHNDVLNVSWFLDSVLQKNVTYTNGQSNLTIKSGWIFYPVFDDSGIRNVTAIVKDSSFETDYIEWEVTVNNTNRKPVFNKTIENLTWHEGNNNTNNFSLHEHFYDLDYINGTDNLTFGYFVHDIYNAWNPSMNLTISINQTTGNVSFYVPHPDWFGAEIVQFYANDSHDIAYANNITINVSNVNDAPTIQCPGTQRPAIEVPYSIQINASDIDNSLLYFSDNTTLFNITLNTGVISFTPNSTDIGTYHVNLSVNDSDLSDSCIVVFEIIDNNRPVLENISNQQAWESSYFEMFVYATDADIEDNISFWTNSTMFNVTTIINNATNATGKINFTPTNSDVGNYTLLVRATDTKGASGYTTFNLTVNNINNVPYFDAMPVQDVRVNHTFYLDMKNYTTDLDNDVLNFTSNSSVFNISDEGLINVTLNGSFIGSYDVNISADDGAPEGTNFTIVVFNVTVNYPPDINETINASAREDLFFTLDLGATDPNGDALSYTANTSMFTIPPSGVISFTPDQPDIGLHVIVINVTDTYGASDAGILYLNISEANDAPYFVQLDNQTLEEDQHYDIYIIGDDQENDPLTFGSNTTMFTIVSYNSTTGLISWTPDDPDVGNHTIEFWVDDGINRTYQLAYYEIYGVNDPPNITAWNPVPLNFSMLENSSQLFNITIFDPDTNMSNITYEWYKDSELVSTTDKWTFSPGFCDAGNYIVKVIVWDLIENDTNIWNVTVNNSNRPPAVNQTIPDFTWRQHRNLTDAFSLLNYSYDYDSECNGSQRDTLTYGVNGNINLTIDIDQTSGNVSFYTDTTWFGVEYVNFSATDGYDTSYSNKVKLNVTENFAPVIDQIYPYGNISNGTLIDTIFNWTYVSLVPNGTKVNTSENSSITFKQNSSDANPEDSSLNYKWFMDGAQQVTTESWTYETDFDDSGYKNITLVVSDGFKQDSFYWNLSIRNVNIAPVFGRVDHTYESDFRGGTQTRTNTTLQMGNITLSLKNSTHYYSNGTFVSKSIDFNDNNLKPKLVRISWSANTPNGTNITLQTRTSYDNITWGNWSASYINSSGSTIANFSRQENETQSYHDGTWVIWDNRYLQYKVNMFTSNTSVTPAVSSIGIDYEIADFETDEDITLSDWIDLDNYFWDPDGESLTYSYNGTGLNNFDYININDGIVSFKPVTDWYGSAQIIFYATDSSGYNTSSNNVTLTIVDITDEQATRTVVRTKTKPQLVPTPELAFIELVVPGALMIGPDETIIAPIMLQNKGEVPLNGIFLRGISVEPGLKIEFLDDYFPSLEIGQTAATEAIISAEDKLKAGTYNIRIVGEVDSPEAEDSAVITISVLENMTDKINAVRDFLQSQPECLELNELILQAQNSISAGNTGEATKLLNDAVEGCRYLIATKEEIVTPSPQEFKVNARWASIIAGSWVLFLIIIYAISAITRRMTVRKYKPK